MKAAIFLGIAFLVAFFAFERINAASPIYPQLTSKTATQIVVQWPENGTGLWGLWKIQIREEILRAHTNGLYMVDGHDLGSGTANVFLYAIEPGRAVNKVVELKNQGWLQSDMRIGVAENYNADRTEWKLRPVYPPGLENFSY